jgi:hypothetical protein
MLPIRQNNPLAPPAYNGLSSIDIGYKDEDFSKLAVFSLTANQILLNQAVQLDKDADFVLTMIIINSGVTPVNFAVRISDSLGNYLNDNFIGSFALNNQGLFSANGYVLLPGMQFPAGSAILVDLQNQTNATIGPINFIFRGHKRYWKQ